MKKQILSLALALALCLGLAAPALADFNANAGTTAWVFEPIGESLDQPAPLPEHLAEYENSDFWFIYDFDPSQVLDISDEEGMRIYTMLEGATFTIYQCPSWEGVVNSVYAYDWDSEEMYGAFYQTETGDDPAAWPYMSPITITFTHDAVAPDGTVADMAKLGVTYDMDFWVEWLEEEYDSVVGSDFHVFFQVVPAVAYASTQTVDIDGKAVEFQMYAIKDADGNDTNYVKVRDVALALDGTAAQFNVGWDGNVNLERGKAYTARNGQENNTPYSGDQPFTCATSATNVDGERADLTAFVITDADGSGSTYYKLRDLGAALGFTVDWSGERGVYIETK